MWVSDHADLVTVRFKDLGKKSYWHECETKKFENILCCAQSPLNYYPTRTTLFSFYLFPHINQHTSTLWKRNCNKWMSSLNRLDALIFCLSIVGNMSIFYSCAVCVFINWHNLTSLINTSWPYLRKSSWVILCTTVAVRARLQLSQLINYLYMIAI